MAVKVAGDLYFDLDGQLCEIKRQLRQPSGYPFDPERLKRHLQDAIEGCLEAVVPSDGEWFDLDLDYTATDPMDLVRGARLNPHDWKCLGPQFGGKGMYQVRLVRLGTVPNLREAVYRAGEQGYQLLEGQARDFFREKFPRPERQDLVVFGGSMWQDGQGSRLVTYLDGFALRWNAFFRQVDSVFEGSWRWAVVNT